MSLFKQIWAVTAMNIRALPQRAGTSLVTVIGVATVIAVMVSLLAIGVAVAATIRTGSWLTWVNAAKPS